MKKVIIISFVSLLLFVICTSAYSELIPRIYWTDDVGKKIFSANANGSDLKDLGITGVDIALDLTNNKIYHCMWNIKRSNLDGSDIEYLVPVNSSLGIAIDLLNSKIYWTEEVADKIQRSNLDGSDVEDLVTGLAQPVGIALDVTAGKMYWADEGSDKIQRANLDGSNVEDLVTSANGIDNPQFPKLDLINNKIYWADNAIDNIQRANLDGSNIEELIKFTSPADNPEGLALDLVGGKMYWANFSAGKIQRANFDGSDIEDMITGLNNPRSIALQIFSLTPTIDAILDFFDQSVADGILEGYGPGKSANARLNALRNMLEMAGDLIIIGDIEGACVQLKAAMKKCDGDPLQPDFVTGPAAIQLSQMIFELMESLGCE